MRKVFINVADFDIWWGVYLSKGEQEGGGGDFLGGLGHNLYIYHLA